MSVVKGSGRTKHADPNGLTVAASVALVCGPRATAASLPASLTPLEQQVVALRQQVAPHVILLVVCGYRARFFGRDSRVCSRRLGIYCVPNTPFEYSSVPVLRMMLHVSKLVAMGYTVAIADQVETAAVRAVEGAKGGSTFSRAVTMTLSRGTTTEASFATPPKAGRAAPEGDDAEDPGAEDVAGDGAEETPTTRAVPASASASFMLFLIEKKTALDNACADVGGCPRSVCLEMCLVSFTTHRRMDLSVMDGALRTHLRSALTLYEPVEIVVFRDQRPPLSEAQKRPRTGDEDPAAATFLSGPTAEALEQLCSPHYGPTDDGFEDDRCVPLVVVPSSSDAPLPEQVAAYFAPFGLDTVFRSMHPGVNQDLAASTSCPQHMNMPAASLEALELFRTPRGAKGSLLWFLDRCMTRGGSRLLRDWLRAPLVNLPAIAARQAAVEFLRLQISESADAHLREMLQACGAAADLEGSLSHLRSGRCSVVEFVRLLKILTAVRRHAQQALRHVPRDGTGSAPELARDALEVLADESPATRPTEKQTIADFVAFHNRQINVDSASSPQDVFVGAAAPPQAVLVLLQDQRQAEALLEAELVQVRKALRLPDLEYRSIAAVDFIIDLPHLVAQKAEITADWIVLSRTKTHTRYHTPAIVDAATQLCAARDRLKFAGAELWKTYQLDHFGRGDDKAGGLFSKHDAIVGRFLDAIAVLDVLRTLATVAAASPAGSAWCMPSFSSERKVRLTGCRHPSIDALLDGRYVPCDVELGPDGCGRLWLLTGPNMCGKSALMRCVAMTVVLAQMGSLVPCTAACLCIFSGVYCRMGAEDRPLQHTSTFLAEMLETSSILAAPDLGAALVLMDELGRGTSSYDGMSVAGATLRFLSRNQTLGFFVTHYTQLCAAYVDDQTDEGPVTPAAVVCWMMDFLRDGATIRFLRRPVRGVTPSSFGVDIAAMANLPRHVCEVAAGRSRALEDIETVRHFLGNVNAI
jgi:DNA mismatch repair protein MSH3